MITERDIKILKFVSDFNFAKTKAVSRNIFSTNKIQKGSSNAARSRLKNLETLNLLESRRDPSDQQKIFYLSQHGAEYLKEWGFALSDSQSKYKVHWPTYKHDNLVLEVYTIFKGLGLNQGFSERAIRRIQLLENEIPDLLIWTECGYIAIEVELTQKSLSRLQEKLKEFVKVENITKIVYLYESESIKNAVVKAMDLAKLSNQEKKTIHAYSIKDFFNEPNEIIQRILV